MSEQPTFHRADGYVALPVGVLDLDLSPGAFRTLVELCRMANTEGFCWPSLQHLSDRLGRSRSAISGYISDLRAEGLLETFEQKTANGYNYRLKFRVTFWQEWRASLCARRQKIERSVRSDERLLESKNHIHINQPEHDLDKLVEAWKTCFAGAPYPSLAREPDPELVERTRQTLSAGHARPVGRDALEKALSNLWTKLELPSTHDNLTEQSEHLSAAGLTLDEADALVVHLSRTWPKHWRRMPNKAAFEKLAQPITAQTQRAKYAVLTGFMKRYGRAQKSLRRSPGFCSLDLKGSAAIPAGTASYPRI
jgi:biotin operon repressor